LCQRDERVLVAWADNVDQIIPLVRDFEDKLIKLVWRSRGALSIISSGAPSFVSPSATASYVNLSEKNKEIAIATATGPDQEKPKPAKKKWGFSYKSSRKETPVSVEGHNAEKGRGGRSARPLRLLAPFYGGLGAALSICKS